jgi:hypothetical protein
MKILEIMLAGASLLAAATEIYAAQPTAAAALSCAQLPAFVKGSPTIKSAKSAIVPTTLGTGSLLHCKVDLLYGENPDQNINIVVDLPLGIADGGTGRVQGAWNGRTQSLGGGGCSGNLLEYSQHGSTFGAAELSEGYVISGNDLGHKGEDCEPGVNKDGTYNMQFIQDFIRNGVEQQVLWTKALAKAYYGVDPRYNYWNGQSTGGRQGYLLAQEFGDQLDGILANVPAIYWTRFATAHLWAQIAMRQLAGGPIAPAKLEQARSSAVSACDAADGTTDGIIDDPRTCQFSAKANICGTPTAPETNCLTAVEASVIDLIWDGPRNAHHNKIWFGLDRGSAFSDIPFFLSDVVTHWDTHDRNADWRAISLEGYAALAEQGSRNIADVTDTDKPLDEFKAHGGKLLSWVGANDQGIFPRGAIHYYRKMAARYSGTAKPDFHKVADFYRLFMAPGIDHTGLGAPGPMPVDPFGALVNWVERGIAPDSLLASGGSAASTSSRTRPLCPYPQRALYSGSGSTDEAKNFHCGGNLEVPAVVCHDVLVEYKRETSGALDFRGTGVSAERCRGLNPPRIRVNRNTAVEN